MYTSPFRLPLRSYKYYFERIFLLAKFSKIRCIISMGGQWNEPRNLLDEV